MNKKFVLYLGASIAIGYCAREVYDKIIFKIREKKEQKETKNIEACSWTNETETEGDSYIAEDTNGILHMYNLDDIIDEDDVINTKYSEVEMDAIEEVMAEMEYPEDGEYYNPDDQAYDEYSTDNSEIEYSKEPYPYPYIIDLDEFENGPFPKTTLDYYRNRKLVDEDGSIIDRSTGLIGSALNDLMKSGENTIYVRNEVVGADYEISYIDEDYEEY
jgi:hypothetical protein